jgi:hypothetical protein
VLLEAGHAVERLEELARLLLRARAADERHGEAAGLEELLETRALAGHLVHAQRVGDRQEEAGRLRAALRLHPLADPDERARRGSRRAEDAACQVRAAVAQRLEQEGEDARVSFAGDLLGERLGPIGAVRPDGLQARSARLLVPDLGHGAPYVGRRRERLRGHRLGLAGASRAALCDSSQASAGREDARRARRRRACRHPRARSFERFACLRASSMRRAGRRFRTASGRSAPPRPRSRSS